MAVGVDGCCGVIFPGYIISGQGAPPPIGPGPGISGPPLCVPAVIPAGLGPGPPATAPVVFPPLLCNAFKQMRLFFFKYKYVYINKIKIHFFLGDSKYITKNTKKRQKQKDNTRLTSLTCF